MLVILLLFSPVVQSFRAHQTGVLGELVTLTCPAFSPSSSPPSSNHQNSELEIEWVLPQMEEIIGPRNLNQSNYQLLPSGNLAIRTNFLRAFLCASFAACCFGTCCVVHKYRWKDTKAKGGIFSCPRDSTQIQFLPDESTMEQGMEDESVDSSPKLLRESPQGEEESSDTRKSLLDSFPFFDAGSSEETLREIPLHPTMTREDTNTTTTPIFYTTVQHHKYLSIRGNFCPAHHPH